MKKFNSTGVCIPERDYMVDISGKLKQIMKLIADGCYFTINKARQYGKTTTLVMVQKALSAEYICVRLSFQGISIKSFETEETFCKMFVNEVTKALTRFSSVSSEYINSWNDETIDNLNVLNEHISKMCKGKKVVLIIDEVDRTSHNRAFVRFLGMLREKFMLRAEGVDNTFHSVIFAGVYDIKNIKLKLIGEGMYTPTEPENKMLNSPWNIAADFTVDMSFNPSEIATMLAEYEADHNTGMDIAAISEEIYEYTSGYPFMVSRICHHIDEKLNKDWTGDGVRKAVSIMLHEKNVLFDDVFKNLENNQALSKYIYELLILGDFKLFMNYEPMVSTGDRYGFFRKQNNGSSKVAISNKIFELLMTDYFIAKDLSDKKQITGVLHTDVIKNGMFDMELCLRKFAGHYAEIFNNKDIEFLERHGRLLFLSYLKPFINGHGFYHIESQFTDFRRMDIVVDFGQQQFIIELKRWRGEQYQEEAYTQLWGYLESKNAHIGYLLTFDFRSDGSKIRKAEWLDIEGKRIFEIIV